jgi:hypothetical protein
MVAGGASEERASTTVRAALGNTYCGRRTRDGLFADVPDCVAISISSSTMIAVPA